MGPCPYCGEKVGAEARICRHCDRNILYSLVLTASLEDRQKHEFLRAWQQLDLQTIRHKTFPAYSEAKKILNEIPLTIAWDLNLFQASLYSKKLVNFAVEPRLQGGLPSNFEEAPKIEKSRFPISSALYAGAALGLFAGALYLLMHQSSPQPKPSSASGYLEPTHRLEELEPQDLRIQSPVSPAQPSAPQGQFQGEQQIKREDVERVLSATVFIRGERSLGSGFLITSDGYILSNSHVTRDMQKPVVTLKNGKTYEARKIREDARYDISLIKIDDVGLPTFKLGDANQVFAGEPVLVIGNPGGLAFTVTRGIVSFNGRVLSGIPYIQTDAAINRGNSGGPMLNQSMEVIGINTLTSLNEQGISFALPINLACDQNGLASGLGSPPTCASFENPQIQMDQASQSIGRDPQSKAQVYQDEVNEHRAQLDKAQGDINRLVEELNQKETDLTAELQRLNSDLSARERVLAELKVISERKIAANKEKAEIQLRYLNSVIGVLERQALDPEFAPIRGQIESQIQKLRASRNEILAIAAQ